MNVPQAIELLLDRGDRGSILIAALIHEMDVDVRFLDALRAAGVDNWDGYDYAHEIMNED